MDNHVHLLIRMEIHALSALFQRVHTTYAQYYNGKHGHIGPVFQGRFDSRPINSNEHLTLAVRYIHENPKDIVGESWKAYPWSSYREYLECPRYCATDFVLGVFGGKEAFAEFHRSDCHLEEVSLIGTRKRLSDEEARAILEDRYGKGYSDHLSQMEKRNRDVALTSLNTLGLSARQIERLTGIGRNIVANAVSQSQQFY